MNAATRAKLLIGVAVAIGAYVVLSPNDTSTVQTANSETSVPRVHMHAKQPTVSHGESAMRALFKLAHRVSDNKGAQALFASHSWYTPPPPPPAPAPAPLSAEQWAVLNAPKAPPLPYSYIGTYSPEGATPVYFLTQADRVYDVHVGDTIDNTYSVDSFSNGQLLMTYKPLNIQQQLSVGGSQ